jgi:hypothetical protein
MKIISVAQGPLFGTGLFNSATPSQAQLVQEFKRTAKLSVCRGKEAIPVGNTFPGSIVLSGKFIVASPGDRVVQVGDFVAVREKNTLLHHIFRQANQWTVFDRKTGQEEQQNGLKAKEVVNRLAKKSADRAIKDMPFSIFGGLRL